MSCTLAALMAVFLDGTARWAAPTALIVGTLVFEVVGRYLDARTGGFQSWMVFTDTLGMCAVSWFLPATYPGVVMLGAATTMLGFVLAGCRSPRWPIAAVTAITGIFGLFIRHEYPPTAWSSWVLAAVGSTAFMLLAPSRIRPIWDSAFRYRETVDASGLLVWEQLAPGSSRMEVNASSMAVLGYPPEAWAEEGFWESVVHPDDAAFVTEYPVGDLAAVGRRRIRVRDAQGAWHSLVTSVSVTSDALPGSTDPGRSRLRGVSYDVTAEERLREFERHAARIDHRTGLPRRAVVVEALDRALGESRSIGLLHVVLTNLREITDAFGFDVADRTAMLIGRRLEGTETCTSVAVTNDGAFAMVIEPRPGEGELEFRRRCNACAEGVLGGVERPVPVGGAVAACRAAIGVVVGPGVGTSAEDLLRMAERAGVRALRATPPIMWVRPEVDRPSPVAHDLTLDLRGAVEHRQFVTHFQPIVHIEDGRWAALEALVRWEHPDRGLLFPGSFLPIAEATGQLREITWIVLADTIAMARRLQEDGTPIRVSMNLDAQSLVFEGAVELICEAVAVAGLDPGRLQIEVIESELLAEPEAAIAALKRFRAAGITTSVDDFGVGHSSLARLAELPVDEVKLDKGFLQGMQNSVRGEPLVRGLVSAMSSFGVRVIAEGVENAEMAEMVRQAGVELVQGFHYSRAVPADQLVGLGATAD